jgi:HK97 family phage portal protein
VGLFNRSIRPPDDITPNPNDPASVPPSTVGPDQLVHPGDPDGIVFDGEVGAFQSPPMILASQWSGWPADWWAPWGSGRASVLTDVAWACIDLNASVLSTMPPYLTRRSQGADAPDAGWLLNPDPDLYFGVEEFLKTLFWDYQAVGEAFVLATARYSTGWPARFHVVPPWAVQVEIDAGRRRYAIGQVDVTGDILHIRYQGSVDDARGHGPLEAGQARLAAAGVLVRYASGIATQGGIPASILTAQTELGPGGAERIRTQWMEARMSNLGAPAVLEGGLEWKATQMSPQEMALNDLLVTNEQAICRLLGVPPFLMGLPSGGDSLTYSTVAQLFDYHWRAGLRPKAAAVMSALSGWVLNREWRVELNRDEYVQPGPYERAQTAQLLNSIVDEQGNPALTVAEIRAAERLDNSVPTDVSSGVLR